MHKDIRYALTQYETALISVWQTDGMLHELAYESDRYYRLEQKQRQFQLKADEAKEKLIEVITKHTK